MDKRLSTAIDELVAGLKGIQPGHTVLESFLHLANKLDPFDLAHFIASLKEGPATGDVERAARARAWGKMLDMAPAFLLRELAGWDKDDPGIQLLIQEARNRG